MLEQNIKEIIGELSSCMNCLILTACYCTRCLAWHPHTHKLAVGYNDDTVKVVISEGGATQPLLKFAGMKGVACLAWQPFAASQLAVGCSSGVLLWTVDPASVVSRPSSSCVVRCVGGDC